MADIAEKVRKTIAGYARVDVAKVTDSAAIATELGLVDDLDRIELVMTLEEAFDIEISDEEMDSMKTVACAVKLVEGKKAGVTA